MTCIAFANRAYSQTMGIYLVILVTKLLEETVDLEAVVCLF